MLKILHILCVYALAIQAIAHKILVISPVNSKSHQIYMNVFVEELMNRGHEVTCITSVSMENHQHQNYTEILIDPPFELSSIVKDEDMFELDEKTPFYSILQFYGFGNFSTSHIFEDKKVQELIHRKDLHFDLVIHEEVFNDGLLIFGHRFQAPVVTICPHGIPEFVDHEMGLITPISHVSHMLLTSTDNMTFTERWYNLIVTAYDLILRYFLHIPMQTQLIEKHFSHLAPLPSFQELRKNISIIFVNAHRSITSARPSMPGLVYIGGAHIKPPKPLPADLKKFLDGSKHGVIYFSLGSIIKTFKMPKDKLNIFLDTFKTLKQRVIWKFENESIPNLPENVLVHKWLPQSDILAHPKVVLFISHGGMFSTFEAIKYGIQLLMVPFRADQFRNAHRVENAGHGKYLPFGEITNESLKDYLIEMLTDQKYANRAKEIAAVFGDNTVHPMDEFIWWIEHVIKFRGAKYLKSHAADMSLFSYLLIDVILVNFLIVVIVAFGMIYAIKRMCCKDKCFDTKQKQQ